MALNVVDDLIKSAFGVIAAVCSGYSLYVLHRRDAALEAARTATAKRDAEIALLKLDLANLRGRLNFPPYPYPD
jgi:hypothetical protein